MKCILFGQLLVALFLAAGCSGMAQKNTSDFDFGEVDKSYTEEADLLTRFLDIAYRFQKETVQFSFAEVELKLKLQQARTTNERQEIARQLIQIYVYWHAATVALVEDYQGLLLDYSLYQNATSSSPIVLSIEMETDRASFVSALQQLRDQIQGRLEQLVSKGREIFPLTGEEQ